MVVYVMEDDYTFKRAANPSARLLRVGYAVGQRHFPRLRRRALSMEMHILAKEGHKKSHTQNHLSETESSLYNVRRKQLPISGAGSSFRRIILDRSLEIYKLNRNHFADFSTWKHVIPISAVTDLTIEGEIIINSVRFQVQPPPQSQVVYLPMLQPVPYLKAIPGGLRVGSIIQVSAYPQQTANDKLAVRFLCGPHPDKSDIAFTFSPRFKRPLHIIRNYRVNGKWGAEDRTNYGDHDFPFPRGVPFDLVINCDADEFRVTCNGKHLINFSYRVKPLQKIVNVEIIGEVCIQNVRIL
ncbi:PREDICTED: galectin-4-like [Priapulus caudatus]|uniref:Galectin n=1 Tax=Priapulus caudatus TaxID=37621 RepID=A0ABM1F4V1_PRICU|nr:PREDICTED: galectin-4-like [Priapulus caudatus]